MPQDRSTPLRQHAVVIHNPGDLRIEVRSIPTPAPGEALVAVGAVGICGSDLGYFYGSTKYPIRNPFVLGHEAAGTIAGLGSTTASSKLAIGDTVALIPGASCGGCELCTSGFDNLCSQVRYLGSAATTPHVDGALQSYIALPLGHLERVPKGVSMATAALLEPLAVAEHAVKIAQVAGQRVLVMGGGTIGQLVALVARQYGADVVDVSDSRPRRRLLAARHGADHALAPDAVVRGIGITDQYHVAFEATGNPHGLDTALRALLPGRGRVVVVGNLPLDCTIPAEVLTRSETWATGIFRFPGGLRRALDLIMGGLTIEWMVEGTMNFEHVAEAFLVANEDDPPLKVQITPPAAAAS